MAPPKTFTGARAVVRINGIPVGHFDSLNYGVTLDVAPIPTLGRFTVAETVYTGAEPVRVTATGWRVINAVGLQGQVQFPTIQQLLFADYMQIDVLDRQTGLRVGIIRDCRPDTYSTGQAARQASQVSYSFIAILVDDETVTNAEGLGATDLPPVN
jgi:hypothetical protein